MRWRVPPRASIADSAKYGSGSMGGSAGPKGLERRVRQLRVILEDGQQRDQQPAFELIVGSHAGQPFPEQWPGKDCGGGNRQERESDPEQHRLG